MSEEKKDEKQTEEQSADEQKAANEEKRPEKETKDDEPKDAQEKPAEKPDEEPKQEEDSKEESEEKEAEVVKELPNSHVKPGMIVRVHEKIIDVNARGEEKTRIQVFEGIVIGVKGSGVSKTMTIRRDANGYVVEKIYPLSSPNIDKVEAVKQFRTRRAKLNHLRSGFKRKMQEVK